MIRRMVTLVAAAAFAFSGLAVSVQPVAASGCGDFAGGIGSRHNGYQFQPIDGYPNGIRADITTPEVAWFHPCASSGDWGNDGPSAWVSIGDDLSSTDSNAIIQIGIISCNSIAFAVCENTYEKWSFWAVGGCGYPPTPVAIGRIYETPHEFSIIYYANPSRWELKIDGVTKHTTYYSDATVSCWLPGPKVINWDGELFDRGDHIGAGCPGCKTRFDEMDYIDNAGGTFTNVDPSAQDCYNGSNYDLPGDHFWRCNTFWDTYNHGQMNMWTDLGGF